MLIFSNETLAFLAVPKTGTTAIEMALKPHADIILTKRRKHTNAAKFRNKLLPFLQDAFNTSPEALAVMRDPIDQIRSWYRYRSRPENRDGPLSTRGCSFDDFVGHVISDDPPPFAGIGSQFAFLTDGKGRLLVEHLFAWERPLALQDFLSDRFGTPLRFKRKNVSPDTPTPLSPATEAALRAARAPEFALHARLSAAGGYLLTPQGTTPD